MANRKKNLTLLDKISFSFDKVMLGYIFLDVLFLILGIIFYSNPYMAIRTAGIVLGIGIILFGLYDIYEFLLRKDTPLFRGHLILGILAIILGILTIVEPFNLVKFLTMVLGIYLAILAVLEG